MTLFDNGDAIGINFNIPSDGQYILKVRLRSGNSVSPTSYWPAGYTFSLTNIGTVSFVGDPSTTTFTTDYGQSYWGVMETSALALTSGNYTLTIQSGSNWAGVDYLEVIQIGGASSRFANNDLIIQKSNLQESSINIYPNPTHNMVNIEVAGNGDEDVNVSIFDAIGKQIYNQVNAGNFKSSVSLKDLGRSSGMYIVKVVVGSKSPKIRKIILN